MGRKLRPDWQDALHHIMVRGIDGSSVFWDDSDKSYLINRLSELVPELDVSIYAWVIMPNHLHLLARTGKFPISNFMQRLLTGYAVVYNRSRNRHGYVFQDRFKSILVQDDAYFMKLVMYIHTNPLKASIASTIEELNRYRWSGHSALIGKTDAPWQKRNAVLSKFGENRTEQINNYLQCINAEAYNNSTKDYVSGTYRIGKDGIQPVDPGNIDVWESCRILGDKKFALKTAARIKMLQPRSIRNREEENSYIEELFEWYKCNKGLSKVMISGNGRTPELCDARAEIAWILTKNLGLSQNDCSKILRMSRSGVRKAIERAGKNIKKGSFIPDYNIQ